MSGATTDQEMTDTPKESLEAGECSYPLIPPERWAMQGLPWGVQGLSATGAVEPTSLPTPAPATGSLELRATRSRVVGLDSSKTPSVRA